MPVHGGALSPRRLRRAARGVAPSVELVRAPSYANEVWIVSECVRVNARGEGSSARGAVRGARVRRPYATRLSSTRHRPHSRTCLELRDVSAVLDSRPWSRRSWARSIARSALVCDYPGVRTIARTRCRRTVPGVPRWPRRRAGGFHAPAARSARVCACADATSGSRAGPRLGTFARSSPRGPFRAGMQPAGTGSPPPQVGSARGGCRASHHAPRRTLAALHLATQAATVHPTSR